MMLLAMEKRSILYDATHFENWHFIIGTPNSIILFCKTQWRHRKPFWMATRWKIMLYKTSYPILHCIRLDSSVKTLAIEFHRIYQIIGIPYKPTTIIMIMLLACLAVDPLDMPRTRSWASIIGITMSVNRPFVPKSDVKQWFTTTTTMIT